MKKQLLLLVMMLLLPIVTNAHDIAVKNDDGVTIYYNYIIGGEGLEVTYPDTYEIWFDFLTYVVIPNEVTISTVNYKVTRIGNRAFKGKYPKLTTVIIPNSVTSIGEEAFQGCTKLASVTIGNSVTRIGKYAFSGCSSLKSVTIPNSVTTIGAQAFRNCSGLKSVTIGNSLTSIGESVFRDCSGLTSVTIGSGVTFIDSQAFRGCSGLTSITIPNSVTSIRPQAFLGCSGLTSVTIPNSVTSIGAQSFCNCSSLTSVTIGSGVMSIDGRAFDGVDITTILSLIEEPFYIIEKTSDLRTFTHNTFNYATLYVPIGTIDKYKAMEGWKDFSFIEEVDYARTYKLTYVVDGEVTKSYELKFHEVITPEPAPTKEGFTFSGWSEIPETMPAHDVTVTGTFTVNKYKLIYKVDGAEYKSYDIEYKATITPEPTPTKEGYTFSGWSEIPEIMPAHDVTVAGTFSINSYKLTYMIDDKVHKETMYEYGATITPEPQPEGDYATFEWVDLPQTMPAHDVVVYASYTSGIKEAQMTTQRNIRIYSPNGKKLRTPQRGVNIVILDDGTVKKVVMK